jgi:hypothetical protein
MFESLLVVTVVLVAIGVLVALDGSRDVFHPLVFIGPMFGFIYFWMPFKLWSADGLDRFFDTNQLFYVQRLNILGMLAFMVACLCVGLRLPRNRTTRVQPLSKEACRRLLIGGGIAGTLGLICWGITIVNVGGFSAAYSSSYTGGWDDSGYVRDGTLLLLVGVLLAITSLAAGGPRIPAFSLISIFGFPWLSQALLMARRGPTFAFAVVVLMGWYTARRSRPPIFAVGGLGLTLAWLVLFLVTNRSNIYLGSNFDVKTDVSDIVEKPDTGNEYIYGSGTVLAAVRRNHYFWMRRYLAQVIVRPIPSAIWPTKYQDFGVPELLNNAGTGEGFADALGWVGATGAAPGIIADLWVELWWLAVPAMALLGWCYGSVWRKAVLQGGAWSSQYVLLSALSIYLVMQTMEAVIFRVLLLSAPCWITWRWALKEPVPRGRMMDRLRARLPWRTPEDRSEGYEHA